MEGQSNRIVWARDAKELGQKPQHIYIAWKSYWDENSNKNPSYIFKMFYQFQWSWSFTCFLAFLPWWFLFFTKTIKTFWTSKDNTIQKKKRPAYLLTVFESPWHTQSIPSLGKGSKLEAFLPGDDLDIPAWPNAALTLHTDRELSAVAIFSLNSCSFVDLQRLTFQKR